MRLNLQYKYHSFHDLSNLDLYKILCLRNEVFVVEQQCIYQDADGKDLDAVHILCYNEEKNLVSYARIIPPAINQTYPSIGRVITSPNYRKNGYGKSLMTYSISICRNLFSSSKIVISAQEYLQKFYENLGFKKVSETYLEDGIPHIKMILTFKP